MPAINSLYHISPHPATLPPTRVGWATCLPMLHSNVIARSETTRQSLFSVIPAKDCHSRESGNPSSLSFPRARLSPPRLAWPRQAKLASVHCLYAPHPKKNHRHVTLSEAKGLKHTKDKDSSLRPEMTQSAIFTKKPAEIPFLMETSKVPNDHKNTPAVAGFTEILTLLW